MFDQVQWQPLGVLIKRFDFDEQRKRAKQWRLTLMSTEATHAFPSEDSQTPPKPNPEMTAIDVALGW